MSISALSLQIIVTTAAATSASTTVRTFIKRASKSAETGGDFSSEHSHVSPPRFRVLGCFSGSPTTDLSAAGQTPPHAETDLEEHMYKMICNAPDALQTSLVAFLQNKTGVFHIRLASTDAVDTVSIRYHTRRDGHLLQASHSSLQTLH